MYSIELSRPDVSNMYRQAHVYHSVAPLCTDTFTSTPGRAQEEDLCRLLPQLCPALERCQAEFYPILPETALLTRGLLAIRRPGTPLPKLKLPFLKSKYLSHNRSLLPKIRACIAEVGLARAGTYELCNSLGECTIITAAMPCGMCDRRPPGGWLQSGWATTVRTRIRAVLSVTSHVD